MDRVNEVVEAAWARAVERWDDPARHEALLGLVAQHSAFAWAAGKYKERAGDPIADAQLERLRKSATATLLATAARRPESKKGPYQRTLLLVALLGVMLVLGLVYAKVIAADHQRKKPLPGRPLPTQPVDKPAAH